MNRWLTENNHIVLIVYNQSIGILEWLHLSDTVIWVNKIPNFIIIKTDFLINVTFDLPYFGPFWMFLKIVQVKPTVNYTVGWTHAVHHNILKNKIL